MEEQITKLASVLIFTPSVVDCHLNPENEPTDEEELFKDGLSFELVILIQHDIHLSILFILQVLQTVSLHGGNLTIPHILQHLHLGVDDLLSHVPLPDNKVDLVHELTCGNLEVLVEHGLGQEANHGLLGSFLVVVSVQEST